MADAEQPEMSVRHITRTCDIYVDHLSVHACQVCVPAALAIAYIEERQECRKREGTIASLLHNAKALDSFVIVGWEGAPISALGSIPEVRRP
jgi:hypothetical protein